MKIEYLITPPLLSREQKKEKCIKGNENRYSGRQDHGTCWQRKKKKRNHQEKYNNMFIQNSTAQRRRLLLAACFP